MRDRGKRGWMEACGDLGTLTRLDGCTSEN